MKRRRVWEAVAIGVTVVVGIAADITFVKTPVWLIDLLILGGLLALGVLVAVARGVIDFAGRHPSKDRSR